MSESQTEWWAPARPDAGEAPQARSTRRDSRDRRKAARARKARRRRTTWVVLLVLVLVGGAGYLVWSMLGDMFDGDGKIATATDYPGPGHGSVEIVVNPGDSGQAIGTTLKDAGVVASVSAFVDAYDSTPGATGIQPGTYSMLLEIPAADAVTALLNPATRVEEKLAVPEGRRATQIYALIGDALGVSAESVEAAAEDTAAIGLPEQAGGEIEGWLYPATYAVQPDDDATSVLKTMVSKTVQVLTDLGVPEDQWQTTLIKASLVEREGKLDDDRPKIARTIENRLDQDWRLDIDAAVAYGAGVNGTELTQSMLEDTSNPYNLRRHKGLPPTPIASPGKASISAVMNPADGDWMYWCTVNLESGETWFSETEAEHGKCVAAMNEWLAENPQ
ncbi:endolytic transglycosylase MltG [Cellulomonas palmilytica]|uniref:endolytic transglycosylase MltG n=1 Tax=Cellulomonas palmilytica TaxID=2608402 RepID=UPI001F1A2297|nr:endolytic transglycosylase MltG [Cellulomonas palmilytica]UJP39078.1 endolytic transglycosylase MltG [Cellulomonas palmilytica]